MPDLTTIARKAARLDSEIKAKSKELDQLKDELKAGGAADYGVAKVIEPAASLKITDDNLPLLKEIFGAEFGKFFEKVVSFKAVKGCREFAEKTLGAAAFRKFISCAEKPAELRVSFPG